MLRYALAIFLSAFLLFQVQPLIGKCILPWFGGAPAVWTACMLFFQAALLVGYAYSHLAATRLGQRRQVAVHLVFVAAAVLLLPIAPAARWKPTGEADPTWRILGLLGTSVGIPYLVLAATSPLLQAWFSRTHPGRSPYRLYALSNAGSLLALVSFPFLVEPWLSSREQVVAWSAAFGAAGALLGWCALRTWNVRDSTFQIPDSRLGEGAAPQEAKPGLGRRLMWLALSACGSAMLLAVTNQMCLDVAVVPFLWVLPLGLYLLSFILCFGSERWYFRPLFWLWLAAAMAGMTWLLRAGVHATIEQQIAGYSLGLFGCCMVCHGELVRLKPSPRHLTSFYLVVSAGGALGGVFVSLLAPVLFRSYLEFHVGLWATCALAMVAFWMDKRPHRHWPRPWLARVALPAYLTLPALIVIFGPTRPTRLLGTPVTRELLLTVWACSAVVGLGAYAMRARGRLWRVTHLWSLCLPAFASALIVLGGRLYHQAREELAGVRSLSRNFYGLLSVSEAARGGADRHAYIMWHGRICHGVQFLSEAGRRRPTTYYSESSGVGLALTHHPRRASGLRVGIVGLGTGTLAAYGRKGDVFRFYEINPAVAELAGRRGTDCPNPLFTYLSDSEADCSTVLGDGRLSLEREPSQRFDVLAIDAFSGDAVPAHLLTREAFGLYRRHIQPDGVIAVHVTNRHLDLELVLRAQAEHFRLACIRIANSDDPLRGVYAAQWVLLSPDPQMLQHPAIQRAAKAGPGRPRRPILWTDDYSDLLRILK